VATIGSITIHVLVFLVAWWSSATARSPLEFITYEIELVSPPPAQESEEPAPAQEELVVERPESEPPPPQEETDVALEEPEPEPPPPERVPTPAEETEKPAAEERAEEAAESGEDINVRLEGVRRDYPAYYNNIITQIQRCFRWTQGGSWETTVYFAIRRDGTVADIDFVNRSGNAAFDFEAMGAVDCAGKGRFGPLPEDLPFDVLPVQFNFRPQGGIRGFFPDPMTAISEVASRP
jgi:outer membrane biosynthesis protein TonB